MKTSLTVLLLVAALCMVGCQQTPTRTLIARVEPFLDDVPVPLNFSFDPAHSSDLSDDSGAAGFKNYYFKGRAWFVDVVEFYKRNMPPERWRLTQELGAVGQKKLVFRKIVTDDATAATCIVTVVAKGEFATGIQILRMER